MARKPFEFEWSVCIPVRVSGWIDDDNEVEHPVSIASYCHEITGYDIHPDILPPNENRSLEKRIKSHLKENKI